MIAYFDTSAFVKLLMHEPGTNRADEYWSGADAVVASMLLYVEARAAVSRARRASRLSVEDADAAVASLDALVGQVALVPATRSVVWAAAALAEVHALRGYDAVHLASAVEVARSVDSGYVVVTSDEQLAAASRAEGLAVYVPA